MDLDWPAWAQSTAVAHPTPPPHDRAEAPALPPAAVAASLAPRLALLRLVAEEGNLTRAAARLHVPQPTASRWLAALGAELGAPVVLRDGRGIRLSRAGTLLAEAAGTALDGLTGAVRQVLDEVDPERGQVLLAFLHTMGELRVPALLRAFRLEHPRVRFTLLQGAQEDVLAHLRAGRADLAFVSPLPPPGEFHTATLDEQELVATVPIGHRLADRKSIRLAELAQDTFVGMKAGYGLRRITDELCRAAGFTPTLAFEGEEVDTLRGLVAAGLGVALLPGAEPTPPPGASQLPLRPRATRSIGLTWITDRPLTPAAETFRQFALAQTPPPALP